MLKRGFNKGYLYYLEGTSIPKRGLMGKRKRQLERQLKEAQKEYDDSMQHLLESAGSTSIEEAIQQIKPFEHRLKEIKLELEKEIEKHETKGSKKSKETPDSGVQEEKELGISKEI